MGGFCCQRAMPPVLREAARWLPGVSERPGALLAPQGHVGHAKVGPWPCTVLVEPQPPFWKSKMEHIILAVTT